MDHDFNADSISWCSDDCHVQEPRAGGSAGTQTATDAETGETSTFDVAVETELVLKRSFSVTGKHYVVTMLAENMHQEDDRATMTWRVLCANPVLGDDWHLAYDPFLSTADTFVIKLTVSANVPLPTMPDIKITEVTGDQVNKTVQIVIGEA